MECPAPASASADFRRQKLKMALTIMGVGMAVVLTWVAVRGYILGQGYPFNTFLFDPKFRFTDLANPIVISKFSNPYFDPSAIYPPFAWLFLRSLSVLPNSVDLVLIFFASLAALISLLATVLRSLVPRPAPLILCCLLLVGTSYPVLFCFDRGNIEILLATLIGGTVFLLARARYVPALLCLVPAICFKLYPALLLVLFLRQRKIALVTGGVLASVAITLLSLHLLSLPVGATWNLYRQNVETYTHFDVYENAMLENSASPWNAFKLGLIAAGKFGLIHPVDFDFRNTFLQSTYSIYETIGFLLAAILGVHVCLVEREFLRCAAALLLLMTLSAPAGGDYRLLHAGLALVILLALKTKRAHDLLVVIFIALIMVPKTEIILTFAGRSESGYADVSIGVLLDPLLALTALFVILYDTPFHAKWSWQRARRLLRVTRFPSLQKELAPRAELQLF